ncbi:MAG: hypothetical protein ACLTK8_03380 [Paeniclostridium sp.]
MATSINVRLSDDLEKKLKKTVELLKKETPLGAEVNNSTIVRGALEEFIRNQELKSKGIKEYTLSVGEMNNDELKQAYNMVFSMLKSIDPETLGVKNLNDLPSHLAEVYRVIAQISLDILSSIKY